MTKMKTAAKFTITTAICVLGVLFVLGCSDNTVGTQTDNRVERFLDRFLDKHPLILGPGQAWIEIDNSDHGFIFYVNNTYDHVVKNGSAWDISRSGTWAGTETGEISHAFNYSYRFVGDVLVLETVDGDNVTTIRFIKFNIS